MKVDVVVSAAGLDGAWPVTVRWPGAAQPVAFVMAAGVLGDAALTATLASLRAGQAAVADVHALGDRLFAALVLPAWPAVAPALAGVHLLELALHLDAVPALSGLPWELMRHDGAFVAAGIKAGGVRLEVAITRRVKRAPVEYPLLVQPLRYLFALGTELGDAVRAGAESLGLLRQIGPTVRERIVQRQSLDHLAGELNAFDPHVLHIIAHGRDGAAGVELEMWNDDKNAADFVAAGELVDRVIRQRGGAPRAPTVVILSACSSGQRLAAAGSTDIATALVQRGVPVVVGMAAEIRDLACRLFTRRLGGAVVDRTPLLAAAVAGRSAALRSAALPADAFDWGLIQLVIGDDIDATLAVRACLPDSDEDLVMRWLSAASLPIDLDPARRMVPPLCGATEVLDGFNRLMTPDEPGRHNPLSVLLLYALPPGKDRKVGKRRAFAEVAAAAIRAGHLPVVVLPKKSRGYPNKPALVVTALDEAFLTLRSRLKLPARAGALKALAAAPFSGVELRQALEADAVALRTDAHAAHDFVKRAAGEVIVMLHDVHLYAEGTPTALELIGATGGGLGERIRVVMSWARMVQDDPAWRAPLEDELADRLRDGGSWIFKVDIRPLEGAHARLAYQRVLLHPFRPAPDFAARRWFLNLTGRNKNALDDALRHLRKGTYDGCAGQFNDERFLDFMDEAVRQAGAVWPADDDDVLKGGGP